MITMAFPVRLSIWDLKVLLAPELQVPTEVLQVSIEGTKSCVLFGLSFSHPLFCLALTSGCPVAFLPSGRPLEEQLTLLQMGVWPQGSTQMEVSSSNPMDHPLRPRRPEQGSSAADVLTVRVLTGKDATPVSTTQQKTKMPL